MPPAVDLVVVFRSAISPSFSKQQTRDDARKAELQYTNLLDTLTKSGLTAAGRRGDKQGNILVFVWCPPAQLTRLLQRDRHSDFIYGLPTSILPTATADFDSTSVTPAERIRLVHTYITAAATEGGLGVSPGTKEWDLVESIIPLHDKQFNETWIKSWTRKQLYDVQVDTIRDQFGDSVALYFAFLGSYTHALIVPSVLGLLTHFFLTPYSALYSTLLLLWACVYVEWWRVRERVLSIRWGTRGVARVEKRRAQYTSDRSAWWQRDFRVLASAPVILGFAVLLAALLTGIFVVEAFVTHLYTGPGSKLVVSSAILPAQMSVSLPSELIVRPYQTLAPTILFVALVPPITAVYQRYALRFTNWENHAHQSTHDASLTVKTFALSAVVAYLGLALSAFVYVPFGPLVMETVRAYITAGEAHVADYEGKGGWWMQEGRSVELNAGRLQQQMFAYTVTNQAVNTFVEIGLPYILRFVESLRSGKLKRTEKKKRVAFEGEEKGGKEEREFLESVRSEVALPEYTLFGDYSEMVTQFGYVVLWSTIWPLAPVMACVNNFFELRSDAFKITVHQRRPVPTRTDSIGPWLDTLSFLAWLGALTNSALVFLFRPHHTTPESENTTHLGGMAGLEVRELLVVAGTVALCASHGYGVMQRVVRHVVERFVWTGSPEVRVAEIGEREVKERYLRDVWAEKDAVVAEKQDAAVASRDADVDADAAFWSYDEGLEEIQKAVKDA
ncbi:hypothetical protein PLICRDRAFT_176887 [Plicaturopsis crispa FD-325 SS-3]|nr:hypothetical protein PLICRDRAFT_176887 [Plicaturopsis crispa FD-325 SS-3]